MFDQEVFNNMLFLFMDHNRSSTDRLVKPVVVLNHFVAEFIFLPDLDAEGIRLIIASPNHELVVAFAVDSAHPLKLGIVTASNNQPVIAVAVEVQICYMKLKFAP